MAKKMVDVEMPTKVQKTTKRSRAAIFVLIALLLFSLFASAYYLIDSLVIENSYKIYVGQSNATNGKGISLSYDPDFGTGYKDLSGRGLKIEDQTQKGIAFGSSSVKDSNNYNYFVMDYLASVGSSLSNTVNTNVTENGKSGEANNDQFVTSKFYLKSEAVADNATADSGVLNYKIGIDINHNVKNALSALRIAIIEIFDETSIYNLETGQYDNDCFNMNVFAQPRSKTADNGDTIVVDGTDLETREFVGTTITGQYTTDENASLVKNVNKGHTNEDWKCVNFHYNRDNDKWSYDSLANSDIVYSINPQEIRSYVIAAWYEASDPDHNETLQNGYVSFTVTFTVI